MLHYHTGNHFLSMLKLPKLLLFLNPEHIIYGCKVTDFFAFTEFLSKYFVFLRIFFLIMKIGIFCSANNNIEKTYFDMTRELGEWIGKNGHEVVFGGCDMGLMEHIARACHDAGGRNIGVIPSIIEENGHVSRYVDVAIHCDNLSDRKDLLLAHSDVIVALPGGIGTLDEVFTVAAAGTIGYHGKQVILYNMNGFWDKLVECLDDLQQKGMIRGCYGKQIKTVSSLEELVTVINSL